MSMTNTVDDSGTTGYPSRDRSRISWGAVLAGAVVAVATTLLLSLLGVAIGAGSIHAVDATSSDLTNYGTSAGIWQIINVALSMAFGGYVAARLSGTHSHLDGELHGLTMWGVAVLLSSVLLAQAIGGVLGLVGRSAGSALSFATATVGGTPSNENNPQGTQGLIERLQQNLASSGDPTTMSHEQVNAEIMSLLGSGLVNGGSLSEPDRNRLIALVAAQSGITREEAAQRVSRLENDAKTSFAQVEQKARAAADVVAQGAASAARALFTALVLGLLAALLGAWIGTRHKRILHSTDSHLAVAPAYAGRSAHETMEPTHAPAYGTRAAYEPVRPSSVSVYDDSDHLLHQYLGGVAFPVSKQELLRLARSGNGGPGLLHSIEGMPDRSFANANEVLRALGMAH